MNSLLPALFLLAITPGLLSAQDDRDRAAPTQHMWLSGQSTANLQTLANAGWRITDIDIERRLPWAFTVALVANTGTYFKQWSYSIGVTAAQLTTTLAQTNSRPIALDAYDDNGTTRFVAVTIANVGVDESLSGTWGHNLVTNDLNALAAVNRRLTNLERYTSNGSDVFAVTSVHNWGGNQRAWGWAFQQTAAELATFVAQGSRIYDFHRSGSTYDAITIGDGGYRSWYFFDLTGAEVREQQEQLLARVVDIEYYRIPPVQAVHYDVIMVDNANGLEQAARDAFDAAPPSALGARGFFLKEVNGPVLAAMRPDTPFEPASVMGTVYHAHAMRRVSTGQSSLTTQIQKPTSCGVAGGSQTLETTLRQMMEGTDDMATLAVSNHFGISNINAAADLLGMTSTDVNYTIGCSGPSPQSTMTLRDLSTLHEQVANGHLGTQRAKFYELMREDLTFPTHGQSNIGTRIDTEAASLGMPLAVRDAFKALLHIAYKGSGVGWFDGGVQRFHYAEGGWMSVPFRDGAGALVPREYTFGAFNHGYAGIESMGREAMAAAELELVWDRVHAAMLTWNDLHLIGSLAPLPGVGCLGSGGVPAHTASGTPELLGSVDYQLANAPPNAIYVAVFGFSSTSYQGIPLPFDLAPIGAFACILRTSVDVQFAGLATAGGTATTTIPIGTDPSTIGTTWFSQHLVLDPPVNAFGATLSNAWQTTVGGWL